MTKKIFLILENPIDNQDITPKITKHYQRNSYITTVKTPQQALKRIKLEVPDLFFFDLTSYEKNHNIDIILQTLQELFSLSPKINIYLFANKIAYLTSLIDDIKKHKGGFVIDTKSGGVVELTQLITNLNIALQGSKILPKELFQVTHFTKLEVNIITMICQKCWKDKKIAEEMDLGERTVQKHIREIKDKLGIYPEENGKINERIALCREANRIGLL